MSNCQIQSKLFASSYKAFAIIAGITFALGTATPAPAQQFMTEGELIATIPGSQLSGVSNRDGKTPWVQAYSKANGSKKGLIAGIWNKTDKYEAEWYIKDGQWCEKGDDFNMCWQMERLNKKTLRPYRNGNALKNPWKIR